MPLLERIGLCSSIILLLWAIISIMPHILALEALDLAQILLVFTIWTGVPIVVVVVDDMSIPLVSRVISTEPTIVVVAVGSVAASSMVIVSTMVMVPSVMAASTVMTVVVVEGMLLKSRLRMVLVDPEPSLPALCLLQAIFQDDSLVQQLLVVRSVCYGQRDPEFIVQAPEELGLPLGISVHII